MKPTLAIALCAALATISWYDTELHIQKQINSDLRDAYEAKLDCARRTTNCE